MNKMRILTKKPIKYIMTKTKVKKRGNLMKKLKIISIFLLMGLIILPANSFARTGTVNAPNKLVLRKGASKSSTPILEIKNNEKVEILEESGEWYKVKYGNNEGYLFAEYVNAEKEEAPKVEEPKTDENKEPSGQNSSQPQNPKSDFTIHLVPSVTSQIIGSCAKEAKITINYEVGNWVNITYGNIQGWVRKYFIYGETKPTEPATNEEEPKAPETNGGNPETEVPENNGGSQNNVPAENTGNDETVSQILKNKKGYTDVQVSANIRKEANTSSQIINTLLRNTEVQILGEEGDFYKIQYHDITGYMSKSIISATPVK